MTRLPAFAAWQGQKLAGLVTYNVAGDVCEIISLDSVHSGRGTGTALVERVKAAAKERGCKKLVVVTTNDNLQAIGFYQKRGFDMARLYHNMMELVRKYKSQLPEMGANGIPLRHEVEFEMEL
nr:GNAT family N-acetyltransferase [Acutalibacter sp. M00204]